MRAFQQVIIYLFFAIFLLCGCLAQTSMEGGSAVGTSDYEARADDSSCGGVLEAFSEFSTLRYFLGRLVNGRRSCVWTISAPNRTLIKLYDIRTYFRVSDNVENYISVGSFNDDNELVWTKLPYSVVPQTLEVPGPTVFIHYVNDVSYYPGLGFRLTYKLGNEIKSNHSYQRVESHFFDAENGIFDYPRNGGTYSPNQWATFVVKPYSNITSGSDASVLILRKRGIEDSVHCAKDSLRIYTFEGVEEGWSKNTTLCGTTPSAQEYRFRAPRRDPIIITFNSDDSGDSEGFDFYWMRYGYV